MINILRSLAIATLFTLLSGCAIPTFTLDNPGQLAAAGSERPAQATVYVLRNNSKASALWAANVWTDNVRRGSLWEKSYIKYSVDPGQHDITIKRSFMSGVPSLAVQGSFEAGKTYYFMIGTGFEARGGEYRFAGELAQLSASAALPLIRTYINANEEEGVAAEAAPSTSASSPANPAPATAL